MSLARYARPYGVGTHGGSVTRPDSWTQQPPAAAQQQKPQAPQAPAKSRIEQYVDGLTPQQFAALEQAVEARVDQDPTRRPDARAETREVRRRREKAVDRIESNRKNAAAIRSLIAREKALSSSSGQSTASRRSPSGSSANATATRRSLTGSSNCSTPTSA